MELLRLAGDIGKLGVRELGALGGETLGLVGALLLGGNDLDQALVVAPADGLGEQPLEVALCEALMHVDEGVLVAEVEGRIRVIVKPATHRLDGEADAIGVAPVTLAQVELRLGERGLEVVLPKPLAGEGGTGVLDELLELLGNARLGALELEDEDGLEEAVVQESAHVLAKTALEDGALERRLVRANECVDQDVRGEDALALGGAGEHVGDAHAGVVGRRLHGNLDEAAHARRAHGQGVGVTCVAVLGTHEALVEERELLVDVKVSVEDRVGVRELGVARVGVEELLVGEGGDCRRVAAGDPTVGRLAEELAVDAHDEDFVRVRQGALHLVVDDAVAGKRTGSEARGVGIRALCVAAGVRILGGLAAVCGLCLVRGLAQLVMPALLLEDARVAIDVGMENRVEIDLHEVLEVAVVR